jgi:hypothetical protein
MPRGEGGGDSETEACQGRRGAAVLQEGIEKLKELLRLRSRGRYGKRIFPRGLSFQEESQPKGGGGLALPLQPFAQREQGGAQGFAQGGELLDRRLPLPLRLEGLLREEKLQKHAFFPLGPLPKGEALPAQPLGDPFPGKGGQFGRGSHPPEAEERGEFRIGSHLFNRKLARDLLCLFDEPAGTGYPGCPKGEVGRGSNPDLEDEAVRLEACGKSRGIGRIGTRSEPFR